MNTPPEFLVLRGIHIGGAKTSSSSPNVLESRAFQIWMIPNFAYSRVLTCRFFFAPPPSHVSVAIVGQARNLYFSQASGDCDRQSGLEKPHLWGFFPTLPQSSIPCFPSGWLFLKSPPPIRLHSLTLLFLRTLPLLPPTPDFIYFY